MQANANISGSHSSKPNSSAPTGTPSWRPFSRPMVRSLLSCRELSAVSRRSGNLQISGIAVSTEAVPHAANCLDKWVHLRAVNLATNAPHINVDDVGCRIEMKVPHMLQQHRPGNDPAFVADQIFEKLELSAQQFDLPPAPGRSPQHEIQFEVTDAQHGFSHHGAAATSQGFHTRQQFREGEWLDEIIVATCTQAADTIV